MRVRAVAPLVVSFNFLAAFSALKRRHNSSQENLENKNLARLGLYIKATKRNNVNGERKPISKEAKEYSKSLLILGNLAVALWIVISSVACWFFNPLLGWFFLIFAFVLVLAILRRLGCGSCYYCKSCTMGFGKLADLFFGSGYMAGVNSSLGMKIVFVYGLLGIVPIALLAVSITQEFAATKIVVLAFLLGLLLYSGIRRKPK
jgi:hypothetical protein